MRVTGQVVELVVDVGGFTGTVRPGGGQFEDVVDHAGDGPGG